MVGKLAKKTDGTADPFRTELDNLRMRIESLEAEVADGRRREADLEAQLERWNIFSQMNPVWFWETDENLRYTFLLAECPRAGGRAAGMALRQDA